MNNEANNRRNTASCLSISSENTVLPSIIHLSPSSAEKENSQPKERTSIYDRFYCFPFFGFLVTGPKIVVVKRALEL
ncbi:hypothetical protein WN48_08312 [Eufriesea mexicana]|uniref:Uncharacterized protein n=1 Tax=Eufriesea mexicana TaxID=516756 RepID=A0A310SIW1_9HYME|nr:hypothetical protein WN48_08312 [Eufriesea mexicana]